MHLFESLHKSSEIVVISTHLTFHRQFGRRNFVIEGFGIYAYSGAEILEFTAMLRAGKMTGNFRRQVYRDSVMADFNEVPIGLSYHKNQIRKRTFRKDAYFPVQNYSKGLAFIVFSSVVVYWVSHLVRFEPSYRDSRTE